MEVRWATASDRELVELVMGAPELFDSAPIREELDRFLASPGHHLGLAVVGGRAVGFVSGVETTHPDKGTEMFLYELGVAEDARGAGVGRALVAALRDRAHERGCYGMWVLTDEDNAAARRTYESAGGVDRGLQVMLDWDLR